MTGEVKYPGMDEHRAIEFLTATSDGGTARDPELVALEEVIAQINDLFSGDHPDSSVRNVVTHIKDRLEESETLQQQAQNNSLAQFSASPDLQNEFVGAVIGAMDSHTTCPRRSSTTPRCRRSCSASWCRSSTAG